MTLFHINTHTLYGSSRRVRPRNGFLILFLFLHLHWCERTGQLKANSTLFCRLSVFIIGRNSRYRETGYPSTEEGPRKGKCMLMHTQFTTYTCTLSAQFGEIEMSDHTLQVNLFRVHHVTTSYILRYWVRILKRFSLQALQKMKRELRSKMEREIGELQKIIVQDDDDDYFHGLEVQRLRGRVQMASFQYNTSCQHWPR